MLSFAIFLSFKVEITLPISCLFSASTDSRKAKMFKLHIFLLLIIARTYTLGNPIGSGDNNAIQQKNLRFITDNKGVQYYPQEKGTFFAKLGLELPVVNGKTPIAKSSWNHIRSRRLLTGKYPTGKPNGFWFILSPRRGNSNKQILVLDIQILWLPNPASRRYLPYLNPRNPQKLSLTNPQNARFLLRQHAGDISRSDRHRPASPKPILAHLPPGPHRNGKWRTNPTEITIQIFPNSRVSRG